MINQEQFEFHQNIVDWLMEGGFPMQEALSIVNYADQRNYSIGHAFMDLVPQYVVNLRDEDKDEKTQDS